MTTFTSRVGYTCCGPDDGPVQYSTTLLWLSSLPHAICVCSGRFFSASPDVVPCSCWFHFKYYWSSIPFTVWISILPRVLAMSAPCYPYACLTNIKTGRLLQSSPLSGWRHLNRDGIIQITPFYHWHSGAVPHPIDFFNASTHIYPS
jgi:hypothetical protein